MCSLRSFFPRLCLGLALLYLVVTLPAARAYVLEGYHWPSNQPIVMDVQLGTPGYSLFDGSASFNQVARDALETWNLYLGNQVQFEMTDNVITPAGGDGINSVSFDHSVYEEDFGEDTLAITYSYYNSKTGIKTEADVVFSSYVNFNSYRGAYRDGIYDFRRVALHEFGHVLGLEHAPQDSLSIMTPVITDIDSLQADDIAGVEAIYGPPTPAAPAITSPLSAIAVAGQMFSYRIMADRTPPTGYQASGLPAGLHVAAATGIISGIAATPGTYVVTIGASNIAGTGTATLTLLVVPVPVITSSLLATVVVNTPFLYQITASGGVIRYTIPNLPAGLTLDTVTGLISGAPTATGSYTVLLQVANAAASASTYLNLTVTHDGALTILHDYSLGGGFSNLTVGSLFKGGDGNIYGSSGGIPFFRYAPDGTEIPVPTLPAGSVSVAPGYLIWGGDGNFYGAYGGSGVSDSGAIFQLTTGGILTTLYRFPATSDYEMYDVTVLQGSDGNLYGARSFGSFAPNNGFLGSLFKLTPDGTLTTLHDFSLGDGYNPSALIQATDGNFYGTTLQGGSGGRGTVFEMTPDGEFTTLHVFGPDESGFPKARLIQSSDGNFYGTTTFGGPDHGSTVFRMDAAGGFTTLHVFDLKREEQPSNPLVQGIDRNFYGMTGYNVLTNGSTGTIFKITPDGVLTVLHEFVLAEGRAGNLPMIPDATGYLYGLTDSAFFRIGTFVVPPAVTLAATTPEAVIGSGSSAVFTLTLSAVQAADTIVHYTIKGTAVNGTDYVELTGTKKVKAGKLSKPIKIVPQGNLGGAGKKTVVLTLAPGDGYTVETTDKVKVRIVSGQ